MMSETRTLSVNGQRQFHRFKKEEIDSDVELFSWLKSQESFPKCYFRSQDGKKEVAACGSVLSLNDVPQFQNGNDSPARFWGGVSFFSDMEPKDALWKDFPRRGFFLPRFEIIKEGGRIFCVTHSINAPITEEFPLSPSYFSASHSAFQGGVHYPTREEWSGLIEDSLKKIRSARFEKVVMARRSTLDSDAELEPFALLERLKKKSSGATLFAFQFSQNQAFVGATPERLYKREGDLLFTEAVAGTHKRGKTEAEDLQLENELLKSQKELSEFTYVKDAIEMSLKPHCEEIEVGETDVIKTENVQHLHCSFSAKLKDQVSDKTILFALHPTPAMGGYPKKVSLDFLQENEPFERGWYASPLGYISEAEAEFAVGIRSALIEKKQLHLFAGAGIVMGSLPENEWNELEDKTALWKDL